MTAAERLRRIASIIEAVDNRCMAVDGPVSDTDDEITLKEIQEIYKLATGPQPNRPQICVSEITIYGELYALLQIGVDYWQVARRGATSVQGDPIGDGKTKASAIHNARENLRTA